jgi:penicillin-binding protein 1C
MKSWQRFGRGLLAMALVCLTLIILADRLWPLPEINPENHATTVVASDGTPLRVFADQQGVWRFKTRPDEVSPLYIEALINYEDRYFFVHPGVNLIAGLRALVQNIRSGKIVSGASTITMQVARIIDPHGRSLIGKFKQVLRAFQLEWNLSKQQILQHYLERAPFGGNLQGVEAASRAYFGKSAIELSHAQAALLAILPQAPSRYRPDRHPEKAAAARDKLVARLVRLGVWSKQVYKDVSLEAVIARSPSPPVLAPILARRLQQSRPLDALIKTSLDYNLQLAVQTRLQDFARDLPTGTTASAVIVENNHWLVRAYVGSALFADITTHGYVDMVSALRSPGSTMKPFIYGLALDQSLIHSESLLVDAPRWRSQYQPKNFSSEFSGAVPTSLALQKSLNLPAVQVLEHLDPQLFNNRLLNAGIRLSIPSGKPNLSMALGGFGISMEELLNLYGALGRGGKVAKLRFSEQQALQQRPLLSPQSAWIVHTMLASAHTSTGDRRDLAFKTGTSFGYRDAWAFGVTGKYTIGVWVGRPDGTPSPGQYGAITALPLLFQLNNWLGDSRAPERPEGISEQTVCWPSGLRVQDNGSTDCYVQKTALGIGGQFPATLAATSSDAWSSAQITLQIAPDTGLRVEPGCDIVSREEKRTLWPVATEPWLNKQWRRSNVIPVSDPRCARQSIVINTEFSIVSIKDGATLRNLDKSAPFPLPLVTVGSMGKSTWYLDGTPLPLLEGADLTHVFLGPGAYELLAINESGATDTIHFKVEQWP